MMHSNSNTGETKYQSCTLEKLSHVGQEAYSGMFLAALFVIGKKKETT